MVALDVPGALWRDRHAINMLAPSIACGILSVHGKSAPRVVVVVYKLVPVG